MRRLTLAILALSLVACSSPTAPVQTPPQGFAHLPPFASDTVGTIPTGPAVQPY
jgi:hypothetical protein